MNKLNYNNKVDTNKIKLVISDIDGTLLNEHHVLSEATKKGIREFSELGIPFMIASGRNYHDAFRVKEKLGVSCYLITSNGAMVTAPDGTIVASHPIESDLALKVLREVDNEKILANFYQVTKWYMEVADTVFTDYYQEGDLAPTHCKFDDVIEDAPIDKLFFTCKDEELLRQFQKKLNDKYGDKLAFTFSMPICMEVMKKGISKGSAIQEISKILDIPLQNIAAFGDAANDIEMLSIVGHGFMMGNSTEELKNATPHLPLILSNRQDGVVRKLSELREQGRLDTDE